MSTKAIRKALESMRGIALTRDQSQARVEAMAEVEAIEKAARHITAFARGERVADAAVSYARIVLEDIAKETTP